MAMQKPTKAKIMGVYQPAWVNWSGIALGVAAVASLFWPKGT